MDNSFTKKGRIGIITGSGPEAGIDLWAKILQQNKKLFKNKFSGDVDAPPVVAHSVPSLGLVMNIEKHEELIRTELLETIDILAEQTDFFCIACNILHYYSENIRNKNLQCEFVSIVDPIKKYINKNSVKNIALVSIGSVMNLGTYSPYKELSKHVNIETPDADIMNSLISNIKTKGPGDPNLIIDYFNILNELKSETVLLACTELPLLPTSGINKKIIDATDLLAQELAFKSYQARFID